MSRRHEPPPPGRPEPGELPVEPDQGAIPPPGEEEDEQQEKTPAPT
ncbi:hypothetical protein [Piscinibacter gummiphilus]|nr:hypothetical protein [Piscinibacter gummiphilus]